MPKAKQISTTPTNDGATVGYEARLWQMADALRGSSNIRVGDEASRAKELGYGG